MRVAIVGAKNRDTPVDKDFVGALIAECALKYGLCQFLTVMTHVGVGLFVKEKCLERDRFGRYRYQLIEVHTKIYGADQMTRAEQSEIWVARNATLAELSDVVYYLANKERRGPPENLISRVEAFGRLYKVFLPGDVIELL